MGLERQIFQRITNLGASNDAVASLSGINTGKLSQASRGLKDLNYDESAALARVVTEMEQLKDAYPGVPINWRRVSDVRDLLEQRRESCRAPEIGSNQ